LAVLGLVLDEEAFVFTLFYTFTVSNTSDGYFPQENTSDGW